MKLLSAATDLKGKRVLVRVDYNIPLKGKKIVDTRRIESSYKTIDFLLKKGATPILVAHMGSATESLAPVASFLKKRYDIIFLKGPLEGQMQSWILEHAKQKTVFLLENIRRFEGEEKNDRSFAKLLASFAEIYVNDAFSVSHRKHASIVGVPAFLPSYAGYQFEAEIKALSGAVALEQHPFLFILGGAKFATKIPLIERFAKRSDGMVISGAILNNFYKASGFEVGTSVVEAGFDAPIKRILKEPSLLLPTDVVVLRAGKGVVCTIDEVTPRDKIVDIGPLSIAHIVQKIQKAKLVIWNGPTGWYEAGFTKGTIALAKAIASARGKAVIGGGDTAAVLEKMFKKTGTPRHLFLSTGGGATLEYLAKGTLVGIVALSKGEAKK